MNYIFEIKNDEVVFDKQFHSPLTAKIIQKIKKTKCKKIVFPQYSNFDRSVDNLPRNLTSLTINSYLFNQKVDNLPPNLVSLILGRDFNQKVDNLPSKLTSLTLSYEFNQNIEKIPKMLEQIAFYDEHQFNYCFEFEQMFPKIKVKRL
jgi:hypothetical protein